MKSRTRAASSLGSEPCVFTRRRNSSWSRSMTFVVRSVFHCPFGNRKKGRSSSPPSRRHVKTSHPVVAHVRSSPFPPSLARTPRLLEPGPSQSAGLPHPPHLPPVPTRLLTPRCL